VSVVKTDDSIKRAVQKATTRPASFSERLLVIGAEADITDGQYHSGINPRAVMASLYAFEVRYDVPVVFTATSIVAARLVERWAFYFARETVEVVNDLWRAG
jgi:hypothetical protein